MLTEMASDAEIASLAQAASGNAGVDVTRKMVERYPRDARLRFMLGSLLASIGDAISAHAEMSRAIELAPGYALARYQLGFFELTSGQPQRALSTWGPLLAEPRDNYLRVFVEGMMHLIRDEFADAIERFETGKRLNNDNSPMNNDIDLLITQCRKLSR